MATLYTLSTIIRKSDLRTAYISIAGSHNEQQLEVTSRTEAVKPYTAEKFVEEFRPRIRALGRYRGDGDKSTSSVATACHPEPTFGLFLNRSIKFAMGTKTRGISSTVCVM